MYDHDYTQQAHDIHAANVKAGWWEPYPDKTARWYDTGRFLVVSELVEAGEAARRDLADDKLPHLDGYIVELADAYIRLLDTLGAHGVNINVDLKAVPAVGFLYTPILTHMKPTVILDACISKLYADQVPEVCMVTCLHCVIEAAEMYCGTMDEFLNVVDQKLDYNRNRLDHKRSERAKPGGKKF